ncbi:hypothetical protein JCM5350_004075 [Sporobolomyces pararoseus]
MSDSSKKRGRKLNDELPPSRSRDVQRAFRARRAAHLTNLENRNIWLEEEMQALKAKLGMGEGHYATGPPPKEVEPDYDGVAEPQRVRGSNRRTKQAGLGKKLVQPKEDQSQDDGDWMKELGIGGSGINTLGLIDEKGAEGNSSYDTRTTYLETPPPLPLPTSLPRTDSTSSFSSFHPLPSPSAGPANYGVYFVPKGSAQASFVGSTPFPPSHEIQSPYPIHSRASIPSVDGFPSLESFRSLTSPDSSISSVSSVSTIGPPPTPPDAWHSLRGDERHKVREHLQGNETEITFQTFHRAMVRCFGKGQVGESVEGDFAAVSRSMSRSSSGSANSSTPFPNDPLPSIRLPRFSSGLPGSTSSTVSPPSTDTYLHISQTFAKLSPYLLSRGSSSSLSAAQISPLKLVNMLQAHDQQNSLLSQNPECFDFSKPPTCLFLPPFSSTSQPPQYAGSRKEMYVLSQAVEQVQGELERTAYFA